MAATAALPELGRHSWLADLASHFVPHYVVTCVVVASALLFARQMACALVMVVVLAVHLGDLAYYWPAGQPRAHAHETHEIVRVLQFNTRHQVRNQHEIIAWLRPRLQHLDVLALLEVDESWEPVLQDLRRDLPGGGWRFTADRNGIALLTRLPIESFRHVQLRPDILPLLSVSVRSSSGGAPLTVHAAHLRPPLSPSGWRARNMQLDQLASAVRAQDPDGTLVLADLNTTAWSVWLARFLASSGLTDAQAERGLTATWAPVWLPSWLGLAIDHTLVGPGIRVLAREVGPRLGSDHRPVVTTLSIPRRLEAAPARHRDAGQDPAARNTLAGANLPSHAATLTACGPSCTPASGVQPASWKRPDPQRALGTPQ